MSRGGIHGQSRTPWLPVQPDAIEAALDPTTSLLLFCGSLVASGVLATLVIWNRGYFLDSVGVPSNTPLQPSSIGEAS